MNDPLCKSCAEWAFARWRGWCSDGTQHWSEKPDLPEVPFLSAGRCPTCSGQTPLPLSSVVYENVHGPHNTGLPDFFRLVIQDEGSTKLRRFGHPFRDPWITRWIPLSELETEMRRRHGS